MTNYQMIIDLSDPCIQINQQIFQLTTDKSDESSYMA